MADPPGCRGAEPGGGFGGGREPSPLVGVQRAAPPGQGVRWPSHPCHAQKTRSLTN